MDESAESAAAVDLVTVAVVAAVTGSEWKEREPAVGALAVVGNRPCVSWSRVVRGASSPITGVSAFMRPRLEAALIRID